MERSNPSLEELYANMSLEEEDEGGVLVAEEVPKTTAPTFVLIGRFLTDKNINFIAMQNVMASLWRPKEGMEVHDLGNYRYSFVFFHILDLQKVIEGGPWSFEQSMLLCHRLVDNEDPHALPLQEVDIWVELYDIPKGCISELVLKNIGDSFGCYIKSDPMNFNNIWKDHLRIRVTMDITKPLKRRMKLKRDASNWNWINFKYERLGSFCFVCGKIGHSDRDCNIVYANPDKIVERMYGVWLRAPNRGNKIGAGARWLRRNNVELNQNESCNANHAATNTSQGASNTSHGDGGRDPRFMDVDGVLREIRGDDEAVRIVTRDKGDTDTVNQEQDQRDAVEDNLIVNEKVIFDPKRRRIETDFPDEHINQESTPVAGLEINNGSKNGLLAGTGLQARQTL